MAEPFVLRTLRTSPISAFLKLESELSLASAEAVEALVFAHRDAGHVQIRLDTSRALIVEDGALDAPADIARRLRGVGGGLTVCGTERQRLFRATKTAEDI